MDDNTILEKQAALQEYREASALYRQGDHAAALAILERLLAVYPKHETVRIAITMCRKALGQTDPGPAEITSPETTEHAEPHASDPGDLDAVAEPDPESDYLEPPTPVPFVYDFATPASPEVGASARAPWWPMPAAMTAGVLIGLLAGIGIKETLAVLQPSTAPFQIETGPLPGQTDVSALEAAAPATLLLGAEERAAIETSEDAGEFAARAVKRPQAPGAWNPTPSWTKDGLTAWTSGLGDFFVYAPPNPKHAALFVHGTPLDPADRPRIALDLAARPIVRTFADRTGTVVIVPIFDAARYADHAHLGDKAQTAAFFATAVLDAAIDRYALPDRRALFFGHSAGAQFVHRFSLVHPERILRAALSAPGAYVMPDDERPWPDGLAACPTPGAYEWALRIPTIVLVGDGDPRQETARTWMRAIERLPRESQRLPIELHRVNQAQHRGEHLLPAALEFLVP